MQDLEGVGSQPHPAGRVGVRRGTRVGPAYNSDAGCEAGRAAMKPRTTAQQKTAVTRAASDIGGRDAGCEGGRDGGRGMGKTALVAH